MQGVYFFVVLVVVEFGTSSILIHSRTHDHRIGKWQKMTKHPKCIGARSEKYATFRHNGKPGFLAAIKFVHASGLIRCENAQVHNTNWGCTRDVKSNIGIILTDWKDHIIFPNKPKEVLSKSGGWYGLAGYDASSSELVMSNFADPVYVNGYQRLRIWYGEDLFDSSEENNHGKVCMYVYGYLL